MSAALTAAGPAHESNQSFVGHPRGLAYLSICLEHIVGFGGFRAVIERAYGRPLSTVALASAIFGLYTGLVYLTPIAGGLIADRWLGRTRTVTIGALLMATGPVLERVPA